MTPVMASTMVAIIGVKYAAFFAIPSHHHATTTTTTTHRTREEGGDEWLCFDNPILPLCQATLSSVDQITCGSVQSMTTAGGLPYDHDGPLEKLFRFRPSNVMGYYFTRVGSGGSMMHRHKDEGGMEDGRLTTTTTTPESMRMKEQRGGGGGKATAAALLRRTYPISSYNAHGSHQM